MASSVKVVYDEKNVLIRLYVEGHVCVKGEGKGYMVCIALSTLTQAMYRAVERVIGKNYFIYKISDGSLDFECNLSKFYKLDFTNKEEYKIITKGYLIGLKSLSDEYPEYIKYQEEFLNGT